MNVREFAVVIVRFFGFWLLFQCIGMIEQTMSMTFSPPFMENQSYQRYVLFASIFNILLYVVLGMGLVWKPMFVADRLPPRKAENTELKISTTSLMLLCFSVAGLVFFISGLKNLAYNLAAFLFTSHNPSYSYVTGNGHAGIVAAVFETAIGLCLLFGFKRIVRGLRHLLQAGRKLGVQKVEQQ
jgi:hypothetical protein